MSSGFSVALDVGKVRIRAADGVEALVPFHRQALVDAVVRVWPAVAAGADVQQQCGSVSHTAGLEGSP